MDAQTPRNPDEKIVREYLDTWKNSKELEKYRVQEHALSLLFKKHYPKNTDIEQILLKVSALNDFYSTNILDTFAVAKGIFELNGKIDIDKELAAGSIELVDKISRVTPRYFYSFATKYCSHHNPKEFPIYDTNVEKMLMYFKKKDAFDEFAKKDLRTYDIFKKSIEKFIEFYKLGAFSLREIDIYLWQEGKKCFPKTIKSHQ